MENELTHWGIRGMKWGIRRYQNKDGSLTSAGKKRYSQEESEETKKKAEEEAAAKREATRAKLLTSSNAEELYKHRDLLTTAEINERLNRIDAERRLAEVASKNKKTALDKIDTVLKYGKKANDIYQFMETPMMKAAIKKAKGEEESHGIDLEKIWKNKDKMTDEQLAKINKRLTTEKQIRQKMDELASATANAAKKAEESTAVGAGKEAAKEVAKNVTENAANKSGAIGIKGMKWTIKGVDADQIKTTASVIKETKLDKVVGNLAKDTTKVVVKAVDKANQKNTKMSDIGDDENTILGQMIMEEFRSRRNDS